MTNRMTSRTMRVSAAIAVIAVGCLTLGALGKALPAGGSNPNGLIATIPGATGLAADQTSHNAFVSSSDGNVRQVTPQGVVTVVNSSPLSGAATDVTLDDVNHVLYVGVAGSPGSIWSIPESGGAASLVYTLSGSQSPTGISYFGGYLAIGTGASGSIDFIDTSGTLMSSCSGSYGPEVTDVALFINSSAQGLILIDHANSKIYLLDLTTGCTPILSQHFASGVNAVSIQAISTTLGVFVGTSTGIGIGIDSLDFTELATQPNVSGFVMGELNFPGFFFWQLDGGKYVRQLTQPGDPTNPTAVAGDQSATISWEAPADMGGFGSLTYVVTADEDSSKTCTTTSTSCVISGLTNGQTYHFTISLVISGGNLVTTNAVTPHIAPVTTSTTPATTTTSASGGLAVTGDDAGMLVAFGIGSVLLGAAMVLRRRLSRA